MAGNKTVENELSVEEFMHQVEHPQRRADSFALDEIFREATGFEPRMWGPSIIGYGRYHYKNDSGREGDFLATGFSPRKANMSVYIMPGYADFGDILSGIGKHKHGKSCFYINKLADVDPEVLKELIRAGLSHLQTHWPVEPT